MSPNACRSLLRRRLFLVEAADENDTLLRLLGPLAVQQVRVTAVAVSVTPEGLAVRLETDAMSDDRAAWLADKLAALPVVRRVGAGWTS